MSSGGGGVCLNRALSGTGPPAELCAGLSDVQNRGGLTAKNTGLRSGAVCLETCFPLKMKQDIKGRSWSPTQSRWIKFKMPRLRGRIGRTQGRRVS